MVAWRRGRRGWRGRCGGGWREEGHGEGVRALLMVAGVVFTGLCMNERILQLFGEIGVESMAYFLCTGWSSGSSWTVACSGQTHWRRQDL